MAFDDLKAELALLINQMENQPEDPHELYLQIREKLNEMRAFGMPLPEDLVAFEEELEAQFAATKRIQLRRVDASGTEKVYLINYKAIEDGSSRNGATVLQEGDVILVPQRRLFE